MNNEDLYMTELRVKFNIANDLKGLLTEEQIYKHVFNLNEEQIDNVERTDDFDRLVVNYQPTFSEGELVRHKTGGPDLVVVQTPTVNKNYYVCSYWCNTNKEFVKNRFTESSLKFKD